MNNDEHASWIWSCYYYYYYDDVWTGLWEIKNLWWSQRRIDSTSLATSSMFKAISRYSGKLPETSRWPHPKAACKRNHPTMGSISGSEHYNWTTYNLSRLNQIHGGPGAITPLPVLKHGPNHPHIHIIHTRSSRRTARHWRCTGVSRHHDLATWLGSQVTWIAAYCRLHHLDNRILMPMSFFQCWRGSHMGGCCPFYRSIKLGAQWSR